MQFVHIATGKQLRLTRKQRIIKKGAPRRTVSTRRQAHKGVQPKVARGYRHLPYCWDVRLGEYVVHYHSNQPHSSREAPPDAATILGYSAVLGWH